MNYNHPELTEQAMNILRSGSTFQWYFIPLLAFVVYIYFNEIEKRNWKPKTQKIIIGSLICIDIIAMIVFAGFLKWI